MNILQMSISAGILILVIVVIRALAINKLPKTMFIALWGIAISRLIIPFSVPSKYSVFNFINRIGVEIALKSRAASGNFENNTLINKSTGFIHTVYNPLLIEPLILVWAVGAAGIALFFAVSFYRSYREISSALPIKGNSLLDMWLREQKSCRSIKILVSDKITTPITYGIIKPKIILPKSMDFGNEPQMRYILAHELIHIRRFDALWKLIMIIVLCLHWVNPMVWVLYVLMNRDLEISCDEKVVKLFGESTKSEYALSLIKMVEQRSRFTPLYSSFSKNATEERIVSIMKFKKTSAISLVLAIMLVAASTLVFAEGTVNKVLRLNGVIQTDSERYSFILDEKGIITVKDTEGNIISTATVDSEGKATLADGDGNVIKTIQIKAPDSIQGKLIRIHNSGTTLGDNLPDAQNKMYVKADMLNEYFAEVNNEGIVTIKEPAGAIIATGAVDSKGAAVLTDANGTRIGNAVVEKGTVTKLAIRVIGIMK